MAAHFEDAIKLLEANQSNAFALSRHIPELVEGFKDALSRIQHLELASVQVEHRLTSLEEANNAWAAQIAGMVADRDAFRKQVDDTARIPIAAKEQLDAMEKRLRAVEGAVGSTAYKGDADKPKLPDPPKAGETDKPTTFAQKVGLAAPNPPAAPAV